MVRVPVHDEIGPVHPDRAGEASRAEEGPDRLRLAHERLGDGRVVEEDDPLVAAGDRLEPDLERLDLARRLPVDLADRRLAEVGDLRAGKAPHEAFRPDDPDFEIAELEDRVVAVEDDDPRFPQRCSDLERRAGVIVVVSEHRHDRYFQVTTGIREDGSLRGKSVRRQVSREQEDVALLPDGGEHAAKALAQGLCAMHVARGCDTNRRHAGERYPRGAFPERRKRVFPTAMPSAPPENLSDLLATMKRAAAALRDADVEFMLGGGLAVFGLGGPPSDHDVDFFVREEDAERALQALVDVGLEAERPPEDWLLKANDGDMAVDLIFRPAGGPVDDEQFDRATVLEVDALRLPVASIDDVLATKLLAITEQEPDFRDVLAIARALREQIDWEALETRSGVSPFARGFITMAEGLGIRPQAVVLGRAPPCLSPADALGFVARDDDVWPPRPDPRDGSPRAHRRL